MPASSASAAAAIVIVDGILLFSEPRLRALFDIKVFVDTPADIRFIRRLLRDQAERGRTAQSVIDQYLLIVRPGHERLTEPAKARADFVVADQTAAVRLEDPQAVVRLAAPLLADPRVAALMAGWDGLKAGAVHAATPRRGGGI